MTLPPRDAATVDALMSALPEAHRRWCGIPSCECSGCARSVATRDEWLAWFRRQSDAVCAGCDRAARLTARDGQTYLACDTCDTFWA